MTTKTWIASACMLAAVGLAPLPSHAGAQRTFVSAGRHQCLLAAGALPHVRAALGQTNPGGEIIVLDSAGYGGRRSTKQYRSSCRREFMPGSPSSPAPMACHQRRRNGSGRAARIDDQQSGRQQRHRVQQRRVPVRRELHDSRLRRRRDGESQVRSGRRPSSSSRTATFVADRRGSASRTAPRRPRRPSTIRG